MRIADVLRVKGAAVATVDPETSVTDLLDGLAERNIGAMVVVGPEGVLGIVSERDVVRKLHEHGADLLDQPVVGDHDLGCRHMRARRLRRLLSAG